jgi:membrane protein
MQFHMRLVGQTFSRWNSHEGQRLGAALAFYTLLSGAPFAVFLLLLLSKFMNQQTVEDKMMSAAQQIFGDRGSLLVQSILDSAHHAHHGNIALIIALVTLLFGASGVFMELRDDLNKMWDARERTKGIWGIIVQRAFAFLLVLAAGVIALVSMLASTAVAFVAKEFSHAIPIPPWALEIANVVVSFSLLTLVFLLIYRYVPDLRLPWKPLWTGAAVSAILFVIGKGLLALYFSKAAVGSAYGAAGSVVVISLWIFYSAQIFLLGAEFTYLWGKQHPPHGDVRNPPPARRETRQAA